MLSLDYTYGTSYLDIGEQDYFNTTCFNTAEGNYWSIGIQKESFKIGDTVIDNSETTFAVFDSGTSLMYFPEKMFGEIIK